MEKKQARTNHYNLSFKFTLANTIFLLIAIGTIGYIGYGIGLSKYGPPAALPPTPPPISACRRDALLCPDGSTVGRSGPYCEFEACPNTGISNAPGTGNCMVGGCNGEICDEASKIYDIVTTCEYKEEYACYNLTQCERQDNGKCGWSYNPEFNKCMFNAKANPGAPTRQ